MWHGPWSIFKLNIKFNILAPQCVAYSEKNRTMILIGNESQCVSRDPSTFSNQPCSTIFASKNWKKNKKLHCENKIKKYWRFFSTSTLKYKYKSLSFKRNFR